MKAHLATRKEVSRIVLTQEHVEFEFPDGTSDLTRYGDQDYIEVKAGKYIIMLDVTMER